MPTTLKITVNSGSAIKPAHNLGDTILCNGSTPIISILDSWSVAFIRPISAVTADPARPANSRAATTGPISITSTSATPSPSADSEPYFTSWLYPWSASTAPMENPDSAMITSDRTPS